MKICPRCNMKYEDKDIVCNYDGVKLEAAPEHEAKTQLQDEMTGKVLAGRFKIISKLGQGGMGAVYKAEQVRMGRICAVKVIPEEMAKDRDAIDRFDREAKMSALINDSHAVTVYDFGETEGGMYFLAMEYVEGETLSKVLAREGVLPLPRIVNIVRQSGEALAAAHKQHIVHRDLKPDNIMFSVKDGQDWVKILDFGIAKISDDQRNDLTRAGMVIGTPLYMSPEQLSGEKIDPRSDIYSFALIVYQMLTGCLPFRGENAQAVMVKRLTENPMPMSAVNSRVSVPPPVESAVMSALVRDRNIRTQTIKQFVDQFDQGARMTTQIVQTPTKPVPLGQTWQAPPTSGRVSAPYPTNPQTGNPQTRPQPYPPITQPPYTGPSGPQQISTHPTPVQPFPPPMPQQNTPPTARGPYAPGPMQQMQQGGAMVPPSPYPQQVQTPGSFVPPRPKKSNRTVWIFGAVFLFIVLMGSCVTAIFILPNTNKPVSVDNSNTNPDTGGRTSDVDTSNATDAVPPEDHYRTGIAHIKAKDFASAADEFRAALQGRPDYTEAQENLAYSLYQEGRYDEAIAEAQQAVKLTKGKKAYTHYILGRALYDSGRYIEASQAFSQAYSLEPTNAEFLALVGFSIHKAGQKEYADKVYDAYLRAFSSNQQWSALTESVRQAKEGADPPAEIPKE